MESGTELLRVVAAIVSAFQTAADTLEMIKDRKEKKKRKKDKEVEELMEIRILHKSLIEGGTRCRKHCENRHQQFGSAFEAGDDIAILALKDVVVSLQTEVIQVLHIARGMENALLDFTTLHESSITNRKDVTRAMDQLCQRIMASMQFQPQHGVNKFGTMNVPGGSIWSSFTSIPPSDPNESYDMPPSPPASYLGSSRQPAYPRAFSQRTLTIRRSMDEVSQRGRYNAPQASPLGWMSSNVDHSSGEMTAGNAPSSTAGEEHGRFRNPDDSGLGQSSQFSVQSSALGSDGDSVLQPASAVSTTASQHPQNPSIRSQAASEQRTQHSRQGTALIEERGSMEKTALTGVAAPKEEAAPTEKSALAFTAAMIASEAHGQKYGSDFGEKSEASFPWTQTANPRPLCLPRIETAADLQRAFEAPEVVATNFDSVYPISAPPDESSGKYLAVLRHSDYEESLLSLPLGMDNIWVPLQRPAMHNRYNGFCKGAWQTRKVVHEGLIVQMTPSLKEPVYHWACRECKFRTKASDVDSSFPNQILFNQKYGVRYRWLFLAKSHRGAESSSDLMETYTYGCIFCAAFGQKTAVYDKLDHLMLHIISKHKSSTMTPEVREKTKCIVGSVVNQTEDWEINVPESTQKGASMIADEFFVSASKFFSRRKGKRS